jgi:hypothetical protein
MAFYLRRLMNFRQPFTKLTPKSTALLFTYAAAVLFLVGLFAPSFTMIPKFGDGFFERLVRLFVSDDLKPRQFSLAGGILHLFQEGEFFIGCVIFLFSVVFPAAKTVALLMFLYRGQTNMAGGLKIIENLGKWSMLDVFVIAALVVCFKGYPGGTHIRLQWGIYVFAISVLLTMAATYTAKGELR